jgi:hypothetical protein
MNFGYKKISLVLGAAIILSSCVTQNIQPAKMLPLIGHGHSKAKKVAYNKFGFDPESDISSGMFNIYDNNPTEFKVNIYIGDNQGCKFIYLKDKKGTKAEIMQSGSIKAYLSAKGVLLDLQCQGDKSNIDYKIEAYSNGVEYDRSDNLSYLAESGSL